MIYKKYLKLSSIINITDLIINDIENNKNISLFDINNLLHYLSFKDSLKINKYYYTDNKVLLKFALLDLKKTYIKNFKNNNCFQLEKRLIK